jgi:Fungal chitosanase of glycosyl hydrolase group 75
MVAIRFTVLGDVVARGSWIVLTSLACAIPIGAHAQDMCAPVVAGLAQLNFDLARDLKSPNFSGTYKSLFDECDLKNTYAGSRLPGKSRCSTDKNRVEFIKRFPDGTIVWRSKAAVDADGSPAAMGACSSSADQDTTSLTFDHGSKEPHANAEEVSFVVIPLRYGAKNISFAADAGIGMGDLAAVVSGDKCSLGVAGDQGPYFRLGEASVKTHGDIGNPQCETPGEHPCKCLKADGSGTGIRAGVTYIVFPKTRPKPLLSQTVSDVATKSATTKVIDFLTRFKK